MYTHATRVGVGRSVGPFFLADDLQPYFSITGAKCIRVCTKLSISSSDFTVLFTYVKETIRLT